ncbi:hypothetical protein L2E82_02781 [Cichorium intybus]|uniref:Uncharacterized protein n=1 Tax=Cichorium intybus TaxID=13427 RepID=A0ACB9H3G0_CICIN|nr:hypothetical protein L2E82_02781 [Cichorium intybus]
MRSKLDMRMKKESGKTLREIRRAKKIQKKLMTDEERLIYNLKIVRFHPLIFSTAKIKEMATMLARLSGGIVKVP